MRLYAFLQAEDSAVRVAALRLVEYFANTSREVSTVERLVSLGGVVFVHHTHH